MGVANPTAQSPSGGRTMLRHTIRTLLRAPSFALATVAKTAIFSVVDGVLLLYSKSQKAREMGNSSWRKIEFMAL